MRVKTESKINKITKPQDIHGLMREVYALNDELDREREQLYMIGLDTRNNVKAIELISMGTVNESLVSVPEVYRTALARNVQRIILVHNHPSGEPSPSQEDITVTEKLEKAGKLLQITLLDHLIYTDQEYTSLRQAGMMGGANND